MKANVQIHQDKPERSHIIIGTLPVNRCIEFFIGWMKKLGHLWSIFSFPLNKKDPPNF
jgi:hypothetical protein